MITREGARREHGGGTEGAPAVPTTRYRESGATSAATSCSRSLRRWPPTAAIVVMATATLASPGGPTGHGHGRGDDRR